MFWPLSADRKLMRSFLVVVVLVGAGLCAEDFTGKVVGITDGDTIRVMHDDAAEKIRLWGIDCPESKQAFGTRAKQFTGDLAFGKVVNVRVRDTDRYHRTVAEIILPDGRPQPGTRSCWFGLVVPALDARRETILRDLEHAGGSAGAVGGQEPGAAVGMAEDRRIQSRFVAAIA
jgi:hypothetical protein